MSPRSAGVLSCFSRVQICATPWTVAHQAPLSMRFSRQEYWGFLPGSSPGDLLHCRQILYHLTNQWSPNMHIFSSLQHPRLSPTLLGCYGSPDWAPCAVQQLLTSLFFLFYFKEKNQVGVVEGWVIENLSEPAFSRHLHILFPSVFRTFCFLHLHGSWSQC